MDIPKPFVDAPSRTPSLGFRDMGAALAGRLLGADPPMMTTGIFGGYGSGKTTLMLEVQRQLDDDQDAEPPVYTVWFDAWRYEHERHLFLPLLAALAADKRINKPPRRKAALVQAIWSFAYGFSLAGLALKDVIDRAAQLKKQAKGNIGSLTSGYVSVHECLRSLTHDARGEVCRRIVVFVDDLDRCVARKALALIEAIKAFLDTDGFLFVLGLDPRAISTYVRGKYGREFCVEAKEYLEKIVQDPFTIQPVELPSKWEDFFQMLRGRGELPREGEEESAANLAFQALSHLPGNIRQIKRLLNTHQIIMHFSPAGTLIPAMLLHLLILQARWPFAYWALGTEQTDPRKGLDAYLQDGKADALPERLRARKAVLREFGDAGFRRLYAECLHLPEWRTLREHMSHMGRYVDVEAEMARAEEGER